MSWRPITMSKLPIVVPCPASWALPHVTTEAGAPAERGSALHAYLARVGAVGREAALAEVPEEYRADCEALDLDRLPTHLAAEVAFLLDLRGTARELGRDIGRRYPVEPGPTELVGTADLIGIDEQADAVVVYDYKSGWSEQPPPAEHWQLRGLALAAAWAYGKSNARVGVIRLREGGGVTIEVDDLDAFDLAETERRLCDVVDEIDHASHALKEGKTPDLRMGPHCRYCPAALHCPAQVKLIREVAAAPEEAEPALAELTPEVAAEAYRRSKHIEAMLKRLKAQLEGVATRAPIPLGEGRFLGPVESTREKILGDIALPILREHYGDEVASAAVEQVVTKTRLREALRPYAERTEAKITHVEKEALRLLRDHDGIEITETTRIAEYKEPQP